MNNHEVLEQQHIIHCIYEKGVLRPLTPIEFEEGEEVMLIPYRPQLVLSIIQSKTRHYSSAIVDDISDEETLQATLDQALHGATLSDEILRERHGE